MKKLTVFVLAILMVCALILSGCSKGTSDNKASDNNISDNNSTNTEQNNGNVNQGTNDNANDNSANNDQTSDNKEDNSGVNDNTQNENEGNSNANDDLPDEDNENPNEGTNNEGVTDNTEPENGTSDNENNDNGSNGEETPDNPSDTESEENGKEEEEEETIADIDSFTYSREGNTVLFGAYPQTLVTDEDILSVLNTKVKTLPTEGEEGSDGWVSYGYFAMDDETRNLVRSNYMWYKDVVSGGIRYRGVYFTSFRANKVDQGDRSGSNSFQDDNGYLPSNVYWFEYEPISWTVVHENYDTLTLVCNLAIDAQQYDYYSEGKSEFKARYDQSTIREWLNATFYETAFNELQKAIIEKTLVDNSLSTHDVGHVSAGEGENTEDSVFLLSAKEINTYFAGTASRKKEATNYAKAQGLSIDYSSTANGNCAWWLRSGTVNYSDYAQNVGVDGNIQQSRNCYTTYTNAIIPALKIKIA